MKKIALLFLFSLSFLCAIAQRFQWVEYPDNVWKLQYNPDVGLAWFPLQLSTHQGSDIEDTLRFMDEYIFPSHITSLKAVITTIASKESNWDYANAHINDHAVAGYLLFSDTNILATKHYVNIREITWSMVTGKPTFFSGDYNDLINRPTLFDGDYGSLTNKPNLFSGSYVDLTGKPALFSGAYADLTGKPTLFSGSYNDLSNKPKISTTYSGTTNSSGIYTVTFSQVYSVAPNIQANITNQGSTNQFIRITSVTTTGFTVHVFQRNSINLLGTDVLLFSTSNVNEASVDVVITEK